MRMANFGVQRSNKDCQSVSFDWHLPLPCVRKQRMVRQGQPGHGQPGGCMCWWQLNKRLTLCHVERAISERSTGEAAFQHSSYGLTHQLHLHTYSNANVTSPKLTLFSCFTFLDFCFHCSFFSFLFFFTSYSLTNLQHKRPFGLTPTGYCPCGPCVLSDQVTNRDHIISQQGLVSTC